MNIVRQVVILSAELKTVSSLANRVRTASLDAELNMSGLPYKQGLGSYKNHREVCFVVIVENDQQIDNLKRLAFSKFNQESILVQDANQRARLVFEDGTEQELGKLIQTTKEIAEKQDAFTVLNEDYFIAV